MMPNSTHKILKNIFHKLLIITVFSTAFYSFSYITADPDLWGHLRFGKELWETKSFFYTDMFSYTAHGFEWINHEWLSELLMFFIFHIFGSAGLLIAKLLIGGATVSIILLIAHSRDKATFMYSIILIISVIIMGPGFMIRPQLLTFLFTALFFFIFHLYLERSINRLCLLPLIMVIWVNSHGGFIIGAGLLLVVIMCVVGESFFNGNYKCQIKNIIIWSALAEISMLINPYGFRILIFLFESLSVSRDITEWNPIAVFNFSYLKFKIFSLLIILFAIFNKDKNRYWEIGIIFIAMVFAFMHQRHTPIFAIVATPFLIENTSKFARKLKINNNNFYSFPSYAVLILALTLLIGFQITYTAKKYVKAKFNIIVDPRVYPVYAVQFLKDNKVKGNILLPFIWGEYVIWKLYPECKVSIDGRFRTVYPEEIIKDHFTALHSKKKWMYLINRYPPDIILARRNILSEKMINANPKWIYVFSDSISIIFIKNGEYHRDVLEKMKQKKLVYPERSLSIYFP